MKRTIMPIEGIRPLENSERSSALSIITDAFSEDPCIKYLIDSDYYDPEKAKRIHAYTLELARHYGYTFTSSEKIEGVSIWFPPKYTHNTPWMFIRAGGLGLRKTIDKGIIRRIKDYGDFSSAIHQRCAKGPHWYLLSISVDKAFQGQGFARKLIDPVLRYLDSRGLPCYLETHNPKNPPIYERFGFRVAEIAKIPGTDKSHWAMLREPAR